MVDRKSPRADFHDYSGGTYFVTLCTRDQKSFFGDIKNGIMHYSAVGKFCHTQFTEVENHYSYASVAMFVIMPNHLHAVIHIRNNSTPNLDPHATTLPPHTDDDDLPKTRPALSVVIGGIKRSVTLFARRNNLEFGWQSRYHDHVIRNHMDAKRICNYIENNIAKWDADCFHP